MKSIVFVGTVKELRDYLTTWKKSKNNCIL